MISPVEVVVRCNAQTQYTDDCLICCSSLLIGCDWIPTNSASAFYVHFRERIWLKRTARTLDLGSAVSIS